MSLWCCHTELSEIADKLTSGSYSKQVVKVWLPGHKRDLPHCGAPGLCALEASAKLTSSLDRGENRLSWGSSRPPKCCRTGWNKLRQWNETFHGEMWCWKKWSTVLQPLLSKYKLMGESLFGLLCKMWGCNYMAESLCSISFKAWCSLAEGLVSFESSLRKVRMMQLSLLAF